MEGRAKPFGETSVLTSTISNPLRFPGQYSDPESGLYHNFQRNYDPEIGTYLEHDPYGVFASGANRYLYAAGNPVSLYDPTGEIIPLVPAIGIGVWAYFAYPDIIAIVDCYRESCSFFDECWVHLEKVAVDIAIGAAAGPALGGLGRAAKKAIGGYGDDALDAFRRVVRKNANNIPPNTPVGRRGNPLDVISGSNPPTSINGWDYTGHALDRMQSRGLVPSVVEDTIRRGIRSSGRDGTKIYRTEQAKVILNGKNQVITVYPQ